jgi:hypothetical protein
VPGYVSGDLSKHPARYPEAVFLISFNAAKSTSIERPNDTKIMPVMSGSGGLGLVVTLTFA